MKKIEAIIRQSKFDDVRHALEPFGVNFFVVSDIKVFANLPSTHNIECYDNADIPRIKIEIVVPDFLSGKVIDKIMDRAYTGELGDGKIMVSRIEHTYRIRTREHDLEAL